MNIGNLHIHTGSNSNNHRNNDNDNTEKKINQFHSRTNNRMKTYIYNNESLIKNNLNFFHFSFLSPLKLCYNLVFTIT